MVIPTCTKTQYVVTEQYNTMSDYKSNEFIISMNSEYKLLQMILIDIYNLIDLFSYIS